MNRIIAHCFIVLVCGIFISGCAHHREVRTVETAAPYTYPLTSPGAKFGALPPPAQNAILAEAGAEEITDIVRVPASGTPVYKVYFRNKDLLPPLYVAADGSVLRSNLTAAVGAARDSFGVVSGGPVAGMKISELPAPVAKRLQERAPNVAVAFVNKETWGDRPIYIITFADPVHYPKLYLAADGTVLNEGPK